MTVVCDASPLLLLARADRLDLLPVLYSTVVVPEEVLREIRVQRDAPAREIQAYTEHPHVQRTDARNEVLEEVEETMGSGERAAIAIALERGADLVVLDDERGRKEARRHGLGVTGAIGVLIEAKEQALVSSMRRELDRLVEAGLWIDEALYDRVLREYGNNNNTLRSHSARAGTAVRTPPRWERSEGRRSCCSQHEYSWGDRRPLTPDRVKRATCHVRRSTLNVLHCTFHVKRSHPDCTHHS